MIMLELSRIKGFPYSVEQNGNVHSIRNFILNQNMNKKGYKIVKFHKYGKRSKHLVHRLVANAFVENTRDPKIYRIVDHIDGDKTNNHMDNLRWISHKENIEYSRERMIQKELDKRMKEWIRNKISNNTKL